LKLAGKDFKESIFNYVVKQKEHMLVDNERWGNFKTENIGEN
jgi:hypothetical protein